MKSVTVWDKRFLISGPCDRIASAVQKYVERLVIQFTNDYYGAKLSTKKLDGE